MKRAASKILDKLKEESSSKNVLVVGHYHSGSILIKEITGEELGPRNTPIMVFGVEVDSRSQQDPANPSCR